VTVDERTKMIFGTIGFPIGSGALTPSAEEVDGALEYVFKSRVGLLFLDCCVANGAALSERAREMHLTLQQRSSQTRLVIAKLARVLNSASAKEWVLFKSLKPFASTPNDTDWFPLRRADHAKLVNALVTSGEFELLERAPLQTTLVEVSGRGKVDTTKKGGIYYIDCYQVPSTDYFVYLDTSAIDRQLEYVDVEGEQVPILSPGVELFAIMYHNVFPERSFSIESYYLIKEYLRLLEERQDLHGFVELTRSQAGESAVRTNLSLVDAIDNQVFGRRDASVSRLLSQLGRRSAPENFAPLGKYPYEVPSALFWAAFFSKLRNRVARRSFYVQVVHMLNPAFLVDVIRIVYRRAFRGGVYEQN
jgi:hypothetical protein